MSAPSLFSTLQFRRSALGDPLPRPAQAFAPVSVNTPSTPKTLRFQGVGDAVSSFISLIDRNRAVELVASDGLGMLAPRTAMATGFRGVDDGRETLIREGAGLFCVALLAGLSNQLMTRVVGNRVNVYNPHGIPAKAWIGAQTLRVYSTLYNQALQAAKSPQEARTSFVQSILSGLESDDRALNLAGRLSNLKTLMQSSENQAIVENALRQLLSEASGSAPAPAELALHLQSLATGNTTALREKLLAQGWGKLSRNGQEKLAQWFQPEDAQSDPLKGTQNFDRRAWERVAELEKIQPLKDRERRFLQERLKLSLNHLGSEDARILNAVDQLALNHGLTSVVHLKTGLASGQTTASGVSQEILMAGQSRKTLLKELKYFLEHFVDRASFAAQKSSASWGGQQKLIHDQLFAAPRRGWRALFPHATDGLVSGALKAKTGYTVIPIGLAIVANGITTFLNNYITQKKYAGHVFFPGEESALQSTRTVGASPPFFPPAPSVPPPLVASRRNVPPLHSTALNAFMLNAPMLNAPKGRLA